MRAASTKNSKKLPMKLASQCGTSDDILPMLAALGVTHVCSSPLMRRTGKFSIQSGSAAGPPAENWTEEGVTKLRARVEKYGLQLEMVPLPLSCRNIVSAENPDIMLGKSPARDQEIDEICEMIRIAGRVGVPSVQYYLTLNGMVRTEPVRGRGGARNGSFDFEQVDQKDTAASVSSDELWQRISYFLKRVVPVAEESKVRLVCHPDDPALPGDKKIRGVPSVMGSIDGMKRFVQTVPSKYHGIAFCQGAVCQMLSDPNTEIAEAIKTLGSKGKIFNVQFSNIRGGSLKFQETFPDEGDLDMLKVIQVYKEVGYSGMIMPARVPEIEGDLAGKQAYAYALGYIQALMQLAA
jgi:mannonate dehydratase